MLQKSLHQFGRTRQALRSLMRSTGFLALMPGVVLGGYWLGGEPMLMMVALAIPIILALTGGFDPAQTDGEGRRRPQHRQIDRQQIEDALQQMLQSVIGSPRSTACLAIEIDEYPMLLSRFGQSAGDDIMRRIAENLRGSLRDGDLDFRLSENRFAIALAPVSHLDLEATIQLATRLQNVIEEPMSQDGTTIYLSCCLGFCLSSRCRDKTGPALLQSTLAALEEAARHAPSAIRAYTEELKKVAEDTPAFLDEVEFALENGQIQPWYQPQISTDTGRITGFEALARWIHPERGTIAPVEFLPALEKLGKLERLGEVMMYQAFSALKSWDTAGFQIPHIGVNFAGDELRNPKLIDKIAWEIDRFDLEPARLSIEVLETVVTSSPDDVVVHNINGLAAMGCRIDLDDFGTGTASIAAIRRFSVQRIKIDRSFVMKVDRDPEQQRMIAAVLTMAERLDLDTLAEGVETVGEHAMLSQLGCGHVQGFGIARPMPFEQTAGWIMAHHEKISRTPSISQRRDRN